MGVTQAQRTQLETTSVVRLAVRPAPSLAPRLTLSPAAALEGSRSPGSGLDAEGGKCGQQRRTAFRDHEQQRRLTPPRGAQLGLEGVAHPPILA